MRWRDDCFRHLAEQVLGLHGEEAQHGRNGKVAMSETQGAVERQLWELDHARTVLQFKNFRFYPITHMHTHTNTHTHNFKNTVPKII